MRRLLVLFLAFVVGCSSSHKKSSVDAVPAAMNPDSSKIIDTPRVLPPIVVNDAAYLVNPTSGENAVLQAGLVAVAMGISALVSKDPVREDLRGSCLYGDVNNLAFSSPCSHVRVDLLDDKKAVVVTNETDEHGNFRFYIPEASSYSVQVADRKGRNGLLKEKVGRGNMVTVFIAP